jgi:hypothetical protein
MKNDRGQVAILKVIITLAIVAFLAIDLGRSIVGRVNLDGTAHSVAAVSAETWRVQHDDKAARDSADQLAAQSDAIVTDWSVRQDGTVTLSLQKTIRSWFFGKIFKSLYVAHATASERGGT